MYIQNLHVTERCHPEMKIPILMDSIRWLILENDRQSRAEWSKEHFKEWKISPAEVSVLQTNLQVDYGPLPGHTLRSHSSEHKSKY